MSIHVMVVKTNRPETFRRQKSDENWEKGMFSNNNNNGSL